MARPARLANLLEVLATVGIALQHSFFHFDGQTFTGYPNKVGLAGWSRRLSRASF